MNTEVREAAVGPTWFAVAVRATAVLARSEGPCPSNAIAGHVQTHAVFLRRVLAQLSRAGIVESKEGRDGGYLLLRQPTDITLADLYRAVNATGPIAVRAVHLDTTCPGDAAMREALGDVMHEAELRVLEVLERKTLADIISHVSRATGEH